MPAVVDQAIVIRAWDWSETSQTAMVLSREHGVVRALAKGSKRPRSAFSGGLQPLTRGELTVILKPGVELANLIAWDLEEIFPAIRRTLDAFHAAMYFAELVQHGVLDRDPHPAVYDALLASLRRLEDPGAALRAILDFQWSLLSETGYRPQLELDVQRGVALLPAPIYAFVPALGGFTTDDANSGVDGQGRTVWRARSETLQALRARARGLDPESDAAVLRAVRLLGSYLSEVMGRAFVSLVPIVHAGEAKPDPGQLPHA